MVKKGILALLLLATLGGGVWWWCWGERYELTLSQEQLLEKLSAKFPFEKSYLFLVTLRFENPRLELEENSDRIRFGCDLTLNLPIDTGGGGHSGPLQGSTTVSGKLRYAAEDGTFYLDDPLVEQLVVTGIPEKWMKKVRSSAEKAVSEFLKRAPLYRLKEHDIKQSAARLVLQAVTVKEKHLVVTLGVG